MSQYDLGKKETRRHAAGTAIGGVVGGVIGGYPGMQIGMAIGGFLFKPDPPKDKDYVNPDYKLYRSKIDPVPDVIGTDMCPGKIIYVNKDTLGVYDSGNLPDMAGSANEAAWKEFIDMMAKAKIAQWAEFAVNFSGRYLFGDQYSIGVVRFNNKPFWFWLMLSDMFENYDNALSPYDPISLFDAQQDYWPSAFEIDTVINQPVKDNTVMYFKGFLGDFTGLQTAPEQSNVTIDVNNLADMNPGQFQVGMLNAFPTFTVEMNREEVFMSPESMQEGANLPTSSIWYNPDGSPYTILASSWYGCRDARNKMFYGRSYQGNPVYVDPVERVIRFAGNDAVTQDEEDIRQWFGDNILKGGSTLQATDVHANRAYICTWRNWWEPYQQRGVYGMNRVNHHHAKYGIKFDIYYHDLDDPEYKVHSLLYDEEFSTYGKEGTCPRYYFSSMVVSDDSIYIFGAVMQTDVMLTDYRTIVSGANSYSKVYADLSQYPDGYWEGCYASLQQNGYDLFREITVQTSTYIELDGEFAAFPSPEEIIMLSKYPSQVTDYAIVGEGSTTTKIICNPPPNSPWSYGGGKDWELVHFIGQRLWSVNIDYIENETVVHLTSALGSTPIPGSRICFGFSRTGDDYDTDITNPILDTDPYDYTDIFLELGEYNGWENYFNENDPAWPFRAGTLTELDGASHHICWKIDKSTGAVSVFDSERVYGFIYFTARLWAIGGISVYACATDKQAFVYSHGAGYPTQKQAYTYIIDFDSGIEEKINRRNQYAFSHTPQWCYFGTTSVKEWNVSTQQYEDVWYSLLYSFDSFNGLNDAVEQGVHFLKLGEGKFSNEQVIAKNSPLEYGLNIDRRGIQRILYRKLISTGPMNFALDLGGFSSENNYKIGKYGIRDHIYFYVNRSNAQVAGRHEMWKYIPPSDVNLAGELYMLQKYSIIVDSIRYQWNRIAAGGSFTQAKPGFYGNGTGLWYHCDETPSEILSKFWNNYNDPRYFPVSMENELTISEATSICKTLVETKIYTPAETIELKERRFQFSQCYDQPKKMYDVFQEIMETCQGFISPCLWSVDYKNYFKLIVPNPNETPAAWFGNVSSGFTSNQLSDDNTKIYADFSAYPDDYWKGDIVDYGEIMDHGYPYPDSRTNVIIEQTSTYIDLAIGLTEYWPDAKSFTLKKDNIKEGSFTFAEKSAMDRPNKVRIEFKNRLLDYIKDVAEAEDTYRLDVLGEEEKIDFYKMHGIKRATQAGRMAQRILDQHNYQKYICGFETDIMGFTLCMGEIIGVSHDTTGWSNKWFRIIAMEELVDFEVKFELEEFNPYTYHDNGVPVLQGFGFGGFPQPYVPYNVEHFEIKEDIEFGRLYFTFDAPTNDAGFFVGARIYRKVGTEYEFMAIVNETVSSVKLAQDVGINDTIIYYDNSTLTGSFPSQGIIWIENELMYYHGIDTTNYAFTNVVRGYKDTNIVEHLVADDFYIKLRSDATVFYNIPSEWAGTTQTFKASSFTIHSLTIGVDLSPSASIDVVGYGVLPYFPESIHIPIPEIAEVEYAFEVIGFDETTTDELWIFLTETLGLNDTKVEDVFIWLSENLGLGDVSTIPETLAQLSESLGLDESATVIEMLVAISEDLGLGDNTLALIIEFLTESLGLGDSKTISETLAQLSEALGLGDVLEAIEDEEGLEEVMMVLNNNLL